MTHPPYSPAWSSRHSSRRPGWSVLECGPGSGRRVLPRPASASVVDFNDGAGGGTETAVRPHGVGGKNAGRCSGTSGFHAETQRRRLRLPGQRHAPAERPAARPARQRLLGSVVVRREVGHVDLLPPGVDALTRPEGRLRRLGLAGRWRHRLPGRGAVPRSSDPSPPRSRPRRPPRRRAAVPGQRGGGRSRPRQPSRARAPPTTADDGHGDGDSEPLGPRRSEGHGRRRRRARGDGQRECPSLAERRPSRCRRPRPMTATRRRPSRRAVSSPRRSRTAACPSGCRSWCSSGSVVPLVAPSGGVGGPARHDRAAAGEGPAPGGVVALGDGPRHRGVRHDQPLPAAADRRGGRR